MEIWRIVDEKWEKKPLGDIPAESAELQRFIERHLTEHGGDASRRWIVFNRAEHGRIESWGLAHLKRENPEITIGSHFLGILLHTVIHSLADVRLVCVVTLISDAPPDRQVTSFGDEHTFLAIAIEGSSASVK